MAAEKVKIAKALLNFLPRITGATSFSFCGLMRMVRDGARYASYPTTAGVQMIYPCLASFRLFVGRMAVIGAGRGKFAELVSDHLLRHQHRNEFLTRCARQR